MIRNVEMFELKPYSSSMARYLRHKNSLSYIHRSIFLEFERQLLAPQTAIVLSLLLKSKENLTYISKGQNVGRMGMIILDRQYMVTGKLLD